MAELLESYPIAGTNEIIYPGECVLFNSKNDSLKQPCVTRVLKIESDIRSGKVTLHVRLYYHPEDDFRGRREFHGAKQLFLSDHYDQLNADTVKGICVVHSLKEYTRLEAVGSKDYFSRFEYNCTTLAFFPDTVAVYCKCEMPRNPDNFMVQCASPKTGFIPIAREKARELTNYICDECSGSG